MSCESPMPDSDWKAGAVAAFHEAIELAGGQTAAAAICGVTQGNISQLVRKRSLLRGEYVLPLERATGVSRHRLRPDLYPIEDSSAVRSIPFGGPIGSCERPGGLHLGEPVR